MLEGLILQAEVALLQKTKQSGRVLQGHYDFPIKNEEKQYHVEGLSSIISRNTVVSNAS